MISSHYYLLQLFWERWDATLRWQGITHSVGLEGTKYCCANCGLVPRLYEHGPFRP